MLMGQVKNASLLRCDGELLLLKASCFLWVPQARYVLFFFFSFFSNVRCRKRFTWKLTLKQRMANLWRNLLTVPLWYDLGVLVLLMKLLCVCFLFFFLSNQLVHYFTLFVRLRAVAVKYISLIST